ncbi:DUF551 domain-containing protein [Citrobacter freundii]|uniref:DUF551 domain-containing protein n=1 Tax=Citrobacter freundii TaxID=546 RepID=UPI000EF28619|nr:hypothetical protein CUC52_11345 [Citrobacter freundii]
MKDHQIRELVNDLRDIAIEYHGTQQLRERIARTVRVAMLQSLGNSEQLDEVGSCNNHMNTPTAQAGNSPVTPDGWVACSERMPDSNCLYLCWGAYFQGDEPEYIPAYFFAHQTNGWTEWQPVEDDCNPREVIITHWMPLPAAPQQEVES